MRLLPVSTPLHRAHHDLQFHIRWPLAYSSVAIRNNRRIWLQARRKDLEARRIAAASGAVLSARMHVMVVAARLRLAGRWLRIHSQQTDAAKKGRRALDGRLDKVSLRLWQMLAGDRCWRRLEPILFDYEMAFGSKIDELRPDIIHANDFRMLGVGARAVLRARKRGQRMKLVWEAREYLPGLKPRSGDVHWLPANMAHEREYARFADAVITVSGTLAELLRTENGLPVDRPSCSMRRSCVRRPGCRRLVDRHPDRMRCGTDDAPLGLQRCRSPSNGASPR